MAVILQGFDNESGSLEEIGVFYDGEFVGEATMEIQIRQMNLNQVDDPEAFLVETYDSHFLQAVQVPDDEVDVDDYRKEYVDQDIDPDDYI